MTNNILYNKSFIIDGDMFAYRSSSAVQQDIDWGDGLWTCHAFLDDAIDQFEILKANIIKYNPLDIIFAFSSPNNFRKKVYSEYKANRKEVRKPTCYKALVEYIKRHNSNTSINGFEADDVIGIYGNEFQYVMVSGDKDFNTIPGIFYNFLKDEVIINSEVEARKNLFRQVIMGDRADNYPGLKGWGKVKADRFIEEHTKDNVDTLYDDTLKLFIANGYSSEYFLQMYTLAKIADSRAYMGRLREEYNI